MTKNSLTHIVIILDRSGSMGACRNATITGFDEFIQKQKEEPGKALVTLAEFNHSYRLEYDEVNIDEVESIRSTYCPAGMTALYDAIGRTIANIDNKLLMKSRSKKPDRVLCVIITDGLENASREYNKDGILSMIHKQEEGNWEFIFLGANIDAVKTATSLGIKASSAADYSANKIQQAFDVVSNKASQYRAADAIVLRNIKSGKQEVFNDADRITLVSD